MADYRSFYWSMENDTPGIFSGDGTPAYNSTAALSTSQAKRGSKSLELSGTGFPIAEFNTEPSQNPDFDWTEGTIIAWVRWTGTWPSGNAQFFSIKNELGTNANIFIYFRGGTSGSVRVAYGSTAQILTATGLTADTWHRLTIKWNTAASPYLSIQVNNNTPVTRTTTLTPIDDSVYKETQILVGNDTATAAEFWVDEFSILKSFMSSATGYTMSGPTSGSAGADSTDFTITATGGYFDDNIAITITSDNGSDTLSATISNGGEVSGGTGSITVTPPPGTDSFTFRINRASPGTSVVSATNNTGMGNPSSINYTASSGFNPGIQTGFGFFA